MINYIGQLMRKEIVWIVAIGVVVGLIVAFGIYRINSTIVKNSPQPQATATPKPGNPELKITLDKPQDNDVVTEDSINVSGITKPLAWITVSGEEDDYIIQAEESGVFNQDVSLIPGVNQIKITAFDSAGNENAGKVLVVYSSSFEPMTFPTSTLDTGTDSSEIRQRVAQKVEAALNRPKAYIGTVTDIADSTIQIKTSDSQIEQISVSDEDIAVVNSTGTTNKVVKLGDIGIGDFIVAMGYINSNSVLRAQRILITDPITEPKIELTLGKVTDTSTKNITVTGLKDSEASTVTPSKNTTISSFSVEKTTTIKIGAINEGDTVMYVTDGSTTTPTVRAIFVIANSQG
jgi:hypothetical protein